MRQTNLTKKKTAGGCCGVLAVIVFIALVASIFSGHGSASTGTDSTVTTAFSDRATATDIARQTAVAVELGQFAATQTAQSGPVDQPTIQPTDTPTPRAQPTHQATPRPTPKPTQPPACRAVNSNPWCYNFSPGNYITNPPSNFCSYFNCIASFVSADDPDGGYIVECGDTTFSQSGGESGACSHHGGVMRPLYSH